MKSWIRKLFCRCNNSVEIISNRKGILQFGKCNKCDRYWLINTEINRMQRLSFDEYLDTRLYLDKLDSMFGDIKMKKKIKDLTLKEVKTMCDKHLKKDENGLHQCKICPYANANEYHCKLDYNHLNEYGNEEIEVEDDD